MTVIPFLLSLVTELPSSVPSEDREAVFVSPNSVYEIYKQNKHKQLETDCFDRQLFFYSENINVSFGSIEIFSWTKLGNILNTN